MPTYQYEAMNAQGQEVKDELDALSSEEAISKIRSQGFFPTKIRERGGRRGPKASTAGGAKARRPRGSGGRIKIKKLTQFTRQLSTLQDAGLPILRSLRILEQQQRPGKLKGVCQAVAEDVEAGSTLSEAMANCPKAFNNLYTNMVAAGEAGGVLDLILNRLADFMEKAQRLKGKVKGAMVYPIAVLCVAFLIVMGIMIVVVPKFEKTFADFGTELPAVTQALMDTSRWIVEDHGWALLIFTPVGLYLLLKLIRYSSGGRYVLDSVTLKLPIMGKIVGKTAIARFTRTLGTLISAGVPILEALNITSDTSGSEVFRRAIVGVHDSIRKGETFAEPLRKARVCDTLVTNMIDVGEETGDLDKMLTRIADNYDEEVDVTVSSLVSLLEPIMIVVLGLVCGFIVVALFMPLVSIIQSISG